jgi:hypothetical protein
MISRRAAIGSAFAAGMATPSSGQAEGKPLVILTHYQG